MKVVTSGSGIKEELFMTGDEIRLRIDENNELIAGLMKPNQFVLNNLVRDLLLENKSLQEKCQHVFEKGFCIFCDFMKNETD